MSLTKKIWVMMGLNDKEFQARMAAVTQKLRTVQSQSIRDARRLSITTQEMFYGMTVPMGLFAKTVIDATKRIESLHLGLATIARSKGINNIEGLIRSTTEIAKLPGLGLEEAFKGVKGLIAVGLSANTALHSIKGLGIGIARAGGNAETFGRVMTQLTQALSKGKLEMTDFKTVFEQMPEARGLLEKAFGPGMSDLQKLRDAGVGVKQVLKALVDGFHELGAEGFMDTMSNKIENLSDSWLQFRAAVGGTLFKEQIHGVLDAIDSGLKGATDAINNMSPDMKNLIQDTAAWMGVIAVGVPAITFIAKMFKIIKGQAYALAASFLRMNPYVLAMIGAAYLIEKIGSAADETWQGLGKEIQTVGRQLKELWKEAVKWGDRNSLFPGLRPEKTKLGINIPKGGRRDYSEVGDEIRAKKLADLEAERERRAKATADYLEEQERILKQIAEATKEVLKFDMSKPLADAYKNAKIDANDLPYFKGRLDDVSEHLMRRMDKKAGVFRPKAYDPMPNVSTEDQAKALFANDENNQAFDAMLPKLKALRDLMSEIWTGPIAEGVEGVADSFGVFVTTVLNDAPDAFGAMADAMKDAIKSMIAALVKLIVKLAIAAALWAIFGPAAGGAKGLGGLKDFLGGSKGGGFLGSLLKGITGFHSGGMVGGSSKYGDKILARVNSGELVLNPSQQKSVYSAMNGSSVVTINGELKVRGRDLVYVFETTKKQINATR